MFAPLILTLLISFHTDMQKAHVCATRSIHHGVPTDTKEPASVCVKLPLFFRYQIDLNHLRFLGFPSMF